MLIRLRQFKDAVFARVSENDYTFLADHLTKPEHEMFLELPVYDQRHSLDVAYRLMERGAAINVVRAGLLHDIGKARCPELTIMRRSVCVMLEAAAPRLAAKKAERGNGKLGQALFVHRFHSELGARVLSKLEGTEERIVWLVRHHDDRKAAARDEDLKQLIEVDDAS